MKINNFMSAGLKTANRFITKNASGILTGFAIGAGITATVLAVKATPKALELIRDAEEEKLEVDDEPLTVAEKVKVAWKPYVPALVASTASIVCAVGACKEGARRNAALAAACKLSETAFSDYKSAVKESVDEKTENSIKEVVTTRQLERNPVSKTKVYGTEKGNTLCYDSISGRYFLSDIDVIKRIQSDLNYRLMNEMYISLNEFYYELGLSCTKIGNDLGWNANSGKIDISFSAHITDDNEPCVVLDYDYMPRYAYQDLM